MRCKDILVAVVLTAGVLMLQGCSKSPEPVAKEIKLNEEVRDGQIAFKMVELREVPSGISITMAGTEKETKIHNFKVKGVIKNESSESIAFDKAFFVSPMSMGVTTFSVTSAMERRSVTLAPGDGYTIEDEIDSSTENSVLFHIQIDRVDKPTLILGPFKICLDKTQSAAQTEDEYANWELTQESMVFLAGGTEITVGGITFANTGTLYRDAYGRIENPQNCFDLTSKKGPIFMEAKIIEGKRRERYFVFADKSAGNTSTVVKRYLDQVVSALK